MATYTEIRQGIATNLQAISGLQESAYVLGSATFPAAQVAPEPIEYDKTFQRGIDRLQFRVTVLVGAASDIGSQKMLDKFIDPSGATSIKAALESDDELGGDVFKLRVTRCSGYRLYRQDNGTTVLGAEWEIETFSGGAI